MTSTTPTILRTPYSTDHLLYSTTSEADVIAHLAARLTLTLRKYHLLIATTLPLPPSDIRLSVKPETIQFFTGINASIDALRSSELFSDYPCVLISLDIFRPFTLPANRSDEIGKQIEEHLLYDQLPHLHRAENNFLEALRHLWLANESAMHELVLPPPSHGLAETLLLDPITMAFSSDFSPVQKDTLKNPNPKFKPYPHLLTQLDDLPVLIDGAVGAILEPHAIRVEQTNLRSADHCLAPLPSLASLTKSRAKYFNQGQSLAHLITNARSYLTLHHSHPPRLEAVSVRLV